ncbi:MAG: holo-ACP synthase [Mycoplasmatales bacterium]
MIKGIGCDIIEHKRVNLKIASKVLTEKELKTFQKSNLKVEFLASRFAIKEAIIKATNKKYLMSEIEILNDEDGRAYTNIEGMNISVSHEKNYSIAMAVWED